jgi:hypothetical protein
MGKAQGKTGGTGKGGARKLGVRKPPIRNLEPLEDARRVRGGALRDGGPGKQAGVRE